ncbi:MAG TPA: hypothetical protein VFZ53_22245, partial [Polyangiaceae bacterium]
MGRTVALSTLRSDVRFKADIGGATVRHTDAQLTRLINQSIQMFRERISDEGSTHYLVPYSGTLGIGPTSPYAFYQLDLSSGPSPALVRTYGIDVTIDGVVCKLEHVPFEARNDYGTIPGGSRPSAWCHFRTDQVGILPASSAAYPFTVWYLPKFTDLSADADTFDGVAGWEEWVVWDVVCQVIARDQFPQAYAIAEQRRAEVEQRVIRGATKVTQAGGAHVGRDSFGSKLPHFLGGSRKPQAVAGGPYVPAGGSVTDAMLADMTGPTVKGVLSGTTRPYSIGIGTLTTYLSTFSASQRGLVPPPVTAGGLFLRDDGTWASTAGAGAAAGPSGAVQYQAGGGTHGGASGFRIHGANPSLVVSLDGTMRVTGGEIAVGSGTTRIQASGIDMGNGSIVNVATLVGQDASLRSLILQTGIGHQQISPLGSGMFLGNLSGTGAASPVAVATMHAFAPTFTSVRPGTVPESGGGTTNFLRADGTWAPAGGAGNTFPALGSGAIQYNGTNNAFSSSRDWTFSSSGTTLLNGTPTGFLATGGIFAAADIGVFGNFAIQGISQKQENQTLYVWQPSGTSAASGGIISHGRGSGTIQLQRFQTAPSGSIEFELGASGAQSLRFMPTGVDFKNHPLAVKSLRVVDTIPNSELASMASGTVKGQLGPAGTPNDVAVATLHAFAPTFTSVNPGTVPESGGGTTNFLRADGTWAAPPGGSATPGDPDRAVQFNDGGAFAGASGIRIVGAGAAQDGESTGDGAALVVGGNASGVSGGGVGTVRGGGGFSIYGLSASGSSVRMIGLRATGVSGVGTGGILQIGTVNSDRITTHHNMVGSGGRFRWQFGLVAG